MKGKIYTTYSSLIFSSSPLWVADGGCHITKDGFSFRYSKIYPIVINVSKKKWVGWLKFAFGYPQHEFTDNSFWLGCEIGILV